MNNLIDDFETLEIFKNAKTDFVQHFEDKNSKKLLLKIKPNSFYELCVIFALNRPISKNNIRNYVSNRLDVKKIKYIHPILEKHLQETFGVFIFTEQIENLLKDLTGLTIAECRIIRKDFGRKNANKIKEVYEISKLNCSKNQKFINNCKTYNLDFDNTVSDILKLITKNVTEVIFFSFVFKTVTESYLQVKEIIRNNE